MALKRNKIEIVFDILKSIKEKQNKIKPTNLLSKANLSHTKFKEYIAELEKQYLIEEIYEKKQKYYTLTQKGEDYYHKLNQMKKFMETFKI